MVIAHIQYTKINISNQNWERIMERELIRSLINSYQKLIKLKPGN